VTQRETLTDTHTHRHGERNTQRNTYTERQRKTHREPHREKQRERELFFTEFFLFLIRISRSLHSDAGSARSGPESDSVVD